MRILVQKFGGSSLASEEMRTMVVKKIIKARQEGLLPVVVVSAMGREGSPYATDTLLSLVGKNVSKFNPRELDLLMSCGEIISGVVLENALVEKGLDVTCLTGFQAGIITDRNYNNARIMKVEPERILENLKKNRIVIVTGFQGKTEDGEITTLGRGGSDTTAAALGVALAAEAIEIYTDVDGIKTADPRIVDNAATLDEVNYNEMCQLAQEGAKVLHPRAVEIAMQQNIPLWVKSTFSDSKGTLVTNGSLKFENNNIRVDRPITGIAHKPNLTQFIISSNQLRKPGNLQEIFNSLAVAGISVDFINLSPRGAIFTVNGAVADKAEEIIEKLVLSLQRNDHCAKVAAVGAGMTGIPGVMAKIVDTLVQEDIVILQSADSYTSIWCLVEQRVMERAVKALHQAFALGK